MKHPTTVPRWLIAFAAGLFVTAGLAVGAWAVDLPYVGWSPGQTSEAFDAIILEEGVTAYPADGELLVLTVVSQPLNVYEFVVAMFDPTVDVYDRAVVRREGETDEEYRTRQLGLMDAAVQRALVIAFDRLGLDVGEVRYRIESVLGGFPAASVLDPGDFVLEVDGAPMDSIDVIRNQLADRAPGDMVELTIERDGEIQTVMVELGETTDEETGEPRTIVGITIGPFIDPPVDIDTNNVGGPSAGMMYTLALIDLLSEEDLTHGHIIAGTGTIEADGSVGGIGGIRQKVVAAKAAGAAYMLVPESNYAAALTADRGSMELVSVATIDDALAFLASLDPA
ncbi:MAG: S16 family serine protease [Acidimicrobiia bacterium]|nr:S16 family serine protease [Acidimicrobiia bacterium]